MGWLRGEFCTINSRGRAPTWAFIWRSVRDLPQRSAAFFPRLNVAAGAEVPTEQAPGNLMLIERSLSDAFWFLVAAAVIEVLVSSGLWEKLQGSGF